MSNSEKDSVVVRDRAGRRQFIRRGAAFVAVGGLAATSNAVYADDCDRNASAEKNTQAPGSDSDTGASADPSGCGRAPKAKITENHNSLDVDHRIKVKKIKA